MLLNEEKMLQTLEAAQTVVSEIQCPGNKKRKESDLITIVSSLLSLITDLVDNLKKLSSDKNEENVGKLEERLRDAEDEIDENRQRSLKGNFIVSSNARNGKPCMIKTDEQLAEEELTLHDHVMTLAKNKFEIDLRLQDISACHRLPSGSIIFCLWNKTPGSCYSKLCDAIKSGKNSEMNVFFNFQLTRRRNSLLYEIRKLKRDKRLHRFYVNENGAITIVVKEGDRKQRITYGELRNRKIRTMTLEELTAIL